MAGTEGRLRWRELLGRIAAAFAATVFALALVEAGLRLFHPIPLPSGDLFERMTPVAEGRTARRSLTPGWHGRHRTPEFNVEVRINSQGIRADRDIPFAKPPGTIRVLGLGDSFMFGQGVELRETFGELLAGEMQQRLGKAVEFVNTGVPSFGTCDELDVLESLGWRFHPDVVLLEFFYNDPEDNVARQTYAVVNGKLEPYPRMENPNAPKPKQLTGNMLSTGLLSGGAANVQRAPEPSPLAEWLVRHLQVARLIAVVAARGGPKITGMQMKRIEQERRDLTLTTALMLKIARVARAHGAKLVVMMIPEPLREFEGIGGKPGPRDLESVYRPMVEALRRDGDTVVDLLPTMRATGLRCDDLYFRQDGHLTPRGNRIVAAALADPVVRALDGGR